MNRLFLLSMIFLFTYSQHSNSSQNQVNQPKQDDRIGDCLQIASNVIIIIRGLHDGYYFVRSIVAPTEDQKRRAQEIKEELETFEKRKQLRQKQRQQEEIKENLNGCLIKHSKESQNTDGIPTCCTEIAQQYKDIAGSDAFEKIKKDFKEYIVED